MVTLFLENHDAINVNGNPNGRKGNVQCYFKHAWSDNSVPVQIFSHDVLQMTTTMSVTVYSNNQKQIFVQLSTDIHYSGKEKRYVPLQGI